jgi:hypothetical protein
VHFAAFAAIVWLRMGGLAVAAEGAGEAERRAALLDKLVAS